MKEPPDHTAEFRAASLLSLTGMIVEMYFWTISGCSRTAVSISAKRTPCLAISSLTEWYTDSDSNCAETPPRYFCSASGIPSRSNVFLMSSGTSSQLRLHPGDLLDDLPGQPLLGLEDVVLWGAPAPALLVGRMWIDIQLFGHVLILSALVKFVKVCEFFHKSLTC